MKSSARNIKLSSVDDLFSTEETRQEGQNGMNREKVRMIPLDELHPFENHPFKVKDDEAMMDTVESVKQYGVLVPAIARPDPEGAIMSEEKKSDMDKVTLRSDTLRRYFPKSYTPKQMEQTIIKLLDVWQKQRQKNQER